MEVVELNFGGRIFVTTRSTLCKHSKSMLAAMFSGDLLPAQQDNQGRFFIDRNGDHFAIILAYLRDEPLQLPGFGIQRRALEAEARFYQLQDLEQHLSCGVQLNGDTKADVLQRDIAKLTFEEGRMVLFESAKAKIGAAKVQQICEAMVRHFFFSESGATHARLSIDADLKPVFFSLQAFPHCHELQVPNIDSNALRTIFTSYMSLFAWEMSMRGFRLSAHQVQSCLLGQIEHL